MTEDQRKVDLLLAASTGRLMRAAATASRLRAALLLNRKQDAVDASAELAESMEVVEQLFQDVARLLSNENAARLASRGLCAQCLDAEDRSLVH